MDARLGAALIAGCTVFSSGSTASQYVKPLTGVHGGRSASALAGVRTVGGAWAGRQLQPTPASDRGASLTAGSGAGSIGLTGGLVANLLLSGAAVGDDLTGVLSPGAAQTTGPLIAQSVVPGTRVTIVGTRGSEIGADSVHALVEQSGELTAWVRLPFSELPESTFVIDTERIICLVPAPGGKLDVALLSHTGRLLARRSIEELLPPGGRRSSDPVSLMPVPGGYSLGVPLECGSIALIELGGEDGIVRGPEDIEVCSVVLSDKFARGAEAWLEEARKLDRAGDADGARFALEAAIETEPNDARGYRELAQFYRRRGETAKQLETLRSGVMQLHAGVDSVADDDWQIGTAAARLTLDYLNAARATHDPQVTGEVLDLALGWYPCMEELVLMRAEVWIKQGERDKAIASFRTALGRIDPNADLAAAHHDVGRFLRREGLTEAALNFCEDAYALGDHSEFLLRGLADVSVELGKRDRAVEWLTLLAERWRAARESITEETRAERAEARLEELEDEISALRSKAK